MQSLLGSLCLLCTQQKSKRAIYSEPYIIVPVLNVFANELFGNEADLMPMSSSSTIGRPCFRYVEKVIKLREELEQKEKEIKNKTRQAGEGRGLQSEVRKIDRWLYT